MGKISSVRADTVTKLYGSVRALSGVSLTLKSGDSVAVMGANGAGKSTLLSLLSLRARPTRGQVLINDQNAIETKSRWQRSIGLLSHDPLVYPDLTVRANLVLFSKLYGIVKVSERVNAIIEEMQLSGFADSRPTRTLSRGQLQRVALARALISQPELLLLDEPAAGLDKRAVSRIEHAVNHLLECEGMTVIVTHDPEVAHRVANRAIMVRQGKVVADETAPKSIEAWRALYFDAIEGDST